MEPPHMFLRQKVLAEIPTNSHVSYWGDSSVDFLGPFSLEENRRKTSTQKSIAKFKSEFGNFAAKRHTVSVAAPAEPRGEKKTLFCANFGR